jgi:hypothetical protein
VWQPRFFPAPLIRAKVLHWATGGASTPNSFRGWRVTRRLRTSLTRHLVTCRQAATGVAGQSMIIIIMTVAKVRV